MEKTPSGTSVGVDDPYEHAGRCDHLTDEGRCRFAIERAGEHPKFAADLRGRDPEYGCPAADPGDEWEFRDCPHYRSRQRSRECVRCGLEERRVAHGAERPLLEEHHLSYPGGSEANHEITVYLCRWCHATVHGSWGRITDDVEPDPEALAEREARRSRELDEAGFETAADRYGDRIDGQDRPTGDPGSREDRSSGG